MDDKSDYRANRHYTTISIQSETDEDLSLYLQQRKKVTGAKMTKQQFIETAIMRELARVRGKNPEEVPDAPNYIKLGQQRRRRKNE